MDNDSNFLLANCPHCRRLVRAPVRRQDFEGPPPLPGLPVRITCSRCKRQFDSPFGELIDPANLDQQI